MESSKIKIETENSGNNRYSTSNSIMTSVATFKSAITRIRDILRGPGMSITGMDSMRHICLYLLSRYMTKEKVSSLGVPDDFAWEILMETAQTKNGGVQKALDCFYHAEEDCLVRHFDRLFGTDKFSFDIKNIQKHKEILEILNGVTMSDVDCQMDILGWVYEQHLKTGSSTAGRDLGQFFTDRFICEYMTKLCAPGFKQAGVPESVCDPSMGTGGFLTSFIKYYKKHHPDTPIDWAIQQKEIHGNDTDSRVAGVARLNLFMETGGSCSTNLLTHDSLYGDLTQKGYDIILANMPFGLKGIKHAECCDRIKELKIRGTKSEPLFLQLMMVSLNRGGRCAVVVPDGMLVNSSTCHDETRKYLLDNFALKRVVKMRGQFFMNTGIQPSILFFENTGNPTTVVEFWDVVKSANGSIEETMVLSVPRERFDASCSLDMRRYQEVKEVANPAGFPMVKLGDVCELLSGKTNNERGEGDIPFYDSNGQIAVVNKHLFDGEYIITARVLSIGSFHLVSGKFWAGDNTINMKVKLDSNMNTRYLFYWLKLNTNKFQNIKSGIIPKIRKSDVAEITIPLPPLAIQYEIVTTLDRIYQPGTTELAETLKLTNQAMDLVLAQPNGTMLEPIVEAQRLMRKSAQMVADVKAQMVADVKAQMVAVFNTSLKSKDSSWLDISSFCKFERSKIQARKNTPGDYPFISLSVSTHNVKLLDNSEHVFISAIPAGNRKMKVQYQSGECSYSSLMFHCVLDKKKVVPKYFYYYLYYNMDILNEYVIGVQPKFSYESFLSRKITMPTLEVQDDIIRRIGVIESQLTSLENLGKQAEDNAHFILESYLGSANNSDGSSEVVPEVEESKEDIWSDSGSSMNEFIQPDEQSMAEVVASTESSIKKVVNRKKPKIAKSSNDD